VRIGISSCLLGEQVRYDGNHKRNDCLVETWGRYLQLVPVCPEVGIGLGVPRPPIRLVGNRLHPHAVGVEDASLDVTVRLEDYAAERARALNDLNGYIFKSKSPSCGLAQVPIGTPAGGEQGTGIYARVFTAAQPLLPVEEESGLADADARAHFITRVFAYHRWRALQCTLTPAHLLAFHAAHKYLLMAHAPAQVSALGRLLADLGSAHHCADLARVTEDYGRRFMRTLSVRPTRGGHANVLTHIMGYLKSLPAPDRERMHAAIEAYRVGETDLLIPIALLRQHLRHHPQAYLARQFYLYPDTRERLLRAAG
jgi:uncharacterized protein YbgA (DUF1722 family)/uncharacterized protein YbbK (DUF523 family)